MRQRTTCCSPRRNQNLWKILGRGRELGHEQLGLKTKLSWNCEGYMVVYVDDLLVVGEGSGHQGHSEKGSRHMDMFDTRMGR